MVGDDYSERVARGAELLDRVRPGWKEQLSFNTLAMETCGHCVLGQLYGHYWHGLINVTWPLVTEMSLVTESSSICRRLGLFSGEHGFTLFDHEQKGFTDDEKATVRERFRTLTNAWRSLVRERRVSAVEEKS